MWVFYKFAPDKSFDELLEIDFLKVIPLTNVKFKCSNFNLLEIKDKNSQYIYIYIYIWKDIVQLLVNSKLVNSALQKMKN